MKKVWIIAFSVMLALSMAACSQKETAPAADETNTQEPVVVDYELPTEKTAVVSVDSIDYDEANQQVLLNITHMTFQPGEAGAEETGYSIEGGESEQIALSKDAKIEFPILEEPAKTVSLMADEFSDEFLNYKKSVDTDLLFTMTEENGQATALIFFYLP